MYTCSKCKDGYDTLPGALGHAMRAHGMTRQQAQNEIKVHRGKR